MDDAQEDYYKLWLDSAYGQSFYNAEINILKKNLPNIFGFHLLQIGAARLNYLELLSDKLKINHKLVLINNKLNNKLNNSPAPAVSILNCQDSLIPLATESIDAVLLSHGLEFSSHPHSLLREVDRILLPEGNLIILGFNPWSLWGLRKAFSFKSTDLGDVRSFPWNTAVYKPDKNKWLSCYRVCDWLNLLNYKIIFKQHYFYQPCINNQKIIHYTRFFNHLGKIIPLGAAGFCIIATKKKEAFELIRPNWSKNLAFNSSVSKAGYIEPTN